MEFTGERVVPELVDPDLLNEHVSRYAFANRIAAALASRPAVLDAGCGVGYGTTALDAARSVTGIDISADAVGPARERYSRPGVRFVQGSCEILPFVDRSFDMVTAFEVVEHLDGWRQMLAEARRVLKPSGLLLISTPNRDFYAESRGESGPNPFHRHEFTGEEFRTALREVFPHVALWTQNHADSVVFASESSGGEGAAQRQGAVDFKTAHFYFGICGLSPLPDPGDFVFAPSSTNVLRERLEHIAKLDGELTKKDEWLRETMESRDTLQARHDALTEELNRANKWAEDLNREVSERDHRLAERDSLVSTLQEELDTRYAWAADLNREIFLRNSRIATLQEELDTRLAWVGDLEAEISRNRSEIGRLQREIARNQEERISQVRDLESQISQGAAEIQRLNTESEERRQTAQKLADELDRTRMELNRVAGSAWVRAGRKLGVAPRVGG